jgi:hypothetical protein
VALFCAATRHHRASHSCRQGAPAKPRLSHWQTISPNSGSLPSASKLAPHPASMPVASTLSPANHNTVTLLRSGLVTIMSTNLAGYPMMMACPPWLPQTAYSGFMVPPNARYPHPTPSNWRPQLPCY